MVIRVNATYIIVAILVWLAAGIFFSGNVSAQDYTQPGNYDYDSRTTGRYEPPQVINPYADTTSVESADSTKPPRTRKPLESYLFDDSTRIRHNFAWNVDMTRNRIDFVDVDTVMNDFQINYPFQRNDVGDAYQGTLGGASIPLNYFDRPEYRDFSFGQAYYSYNFLPSNVMFFNGKKPLTRFSYLTAGQKATVEENFNILHAQNISPSSGFNVNYYSRGTRGVYQHQKARAKNLSVAFSHTGKKYTLHAGYIFNAVLNQENGGILNDDALTDPETELDQNLEVLLRDAANYIKGNTFYAVQSYGIPLRKLSENDFTIADRSTIFIGHSFEYSRWKRNYSDTKEGSETVQDEETKNFYDHWHINPVQTYDSIFESRMSNRVFIQLQPFDRNAIIGTIDAGIGMDNHLYYQFRPADFINGRNKGDKKTDYYMYGSVDGKFKRYLDWGGNVKFTPAGYRSGDLNIGAHAAISAYVREKPITLTGTFYHDRRSPDYWSENLFSNHFVWSEPFDKENETRFEAKLTMPSAGLEVGTAQSVVNNKIYYAADKNPVQHSGSVSLTGVYARKDFTLGGFHLNHRVLLQWSTSQEVVPVPLASAYLSYYFEFNVVKDVLRVQFGVDGRYNTNYYAPGWNPSAAVFYNQREIEVGEYPMLDVFVNAKWKRMRILLKLRHASQDMMGDKGYFALPHYPLNPRVFQLGFSWNFYD